jgi:hypothetical protein
MITFLRIMKLFLVLLRSFMNEVSKVVLLKYLCHKIYLIIHACGFFMIWFIEISELFSLVLLLIFVI